MLSIEVKGTEKLIDALKVAIEKEAIKGVVKKHTANLQKKAVVKAQFKKGYSTGATRRSITSSLEDGGLVGKVKAGTEYSGYLEKGTRKMEAQPFMRPALDEVEPAFMSDLREVMS